jgi:hypothetical protein
VADPREKAGSAKPPSLRRGWTVEPLPTVSGAYVTRVRKSEPRCCSWGRCGDRGSTGGVSASARLARSRKKGLRTLGVRGFAGAASDGVDWPPLSDLELAELTWHRWGSNIRVVHMTGQHEYLGTGTFEQAEAVARALGLVRVPTLASYARWVRDPQGSRGPVT